MLLPKENDDSFPSLVFLDGLYVEKCVKADTYAGYVLYRKDDEILRAEGSVVIIHGARNTDWHLEEIFDSIKGCGLNTNI